MRQPMRSKIPHHKAGDQQDDGRPQQTSKSAMLRQDHFHLDDAENNGFLEHALNIVGGLLLIMSLPALRIY